MKKRLVKRISIDNNLIKSLILSSAKKSKSQKRLELDDETAGSKVSLAYDALRELLEALAISKGYKIYNHECYTAFFKQVMNESELGDRFDKFRKIRNDINYYGKDISAAEAKPLIEDMAGYIEELKGKFALL
ncbi:hypothetical protein HY487_01155 [Candidatus Woesearchaeota archaeon]|nr:hypothetical protein [Candidatus Woesearchaeota archaeon]